MFRVGLDCEEHRQDSPQRRQDMGPIFQKIKLQLSEPGDPALYARSLTFGFAGGRDDVFAGNGAIV